MKIDPVQASLVLFLVFVNNWCAVIFKWKKIERTIKPFSTLLIILWTGTVASWNVEGLLIILLLAQFFGLVGDIFLLFKTKYFMMGLVSFLVGHLLYVFILILSNFKNNHLNNFIFSKVWWLLIITFIWAGMVLTFNIFILPKNSRIIMRFKLWGSAQLYGWILTLLFFMASVSIINKSAWSPAYLFLPIGAFLFFISDSILAYDRFNKNVPKIRTLVMPTYHLAQLSLAWGFLNYLDLV